MDSPPTPGTSAIRRRRAMAMMARLANQPYPIITQRTKAWVEGLDNAPQQTANTASVADSMDEEDYSEQSALTEHLLSEKYAATLGGPGWYCETVASSMHTASMYDETDKKDDGGSANVRPLRSMYDWEGDVVDDVVQKKLDMEDGERDGDSVDVPSSRSITPPPKVPRKGKKYATRAVLDEDYDGETARPVTVGRVSFADDTIYLPSSTAVETTSSPHGSPPPPQRKRRKAAKSARGSWRTPINRGSRGEGGSGFA